MKVTPGGAVKVLDFGLAKALDDDRAATSISNSPTLSLAATRAGVILGTAAYIPPEQVRGAAVDRRADIWAFGVVLYEMLTGKQAFTGESVSDVLASVLKFDPDWSTACRIEPIHEMASVGKELGPAVARLRCRVQCGHWEERCRRIDR